MGTGPDRYALLIGAMKSGTTSLFDAATQHPAIAGSTPKEPHFFSYDRRYRKGRAWYEACWDLHGEEVAMEASVSYSQHAFYPDVPARIEAFGIDRFVYIVRDPVERIASHYRHMLAAVHGRAFFGRRAPLVHPVALETSDYAKQLDAYADRFGKDAVLVVPFEDYAADPVRWVRRVWRHVGVDRHVPDPRPTPRNPSETKNRLRPVWWKVAEVVPETPLRRLALRHRRGPAAGLFWTQDPVRFTLSDDQVDLIRTDLAPAMAHLHRDYDVDVRRWGF